MTEITNLEMTLLCAEAMHQVELGDLYDPLHDDAQAMALVKKFALGITNDGIRWLVNNRTNVVQHTNLNRAIVECVAKMQAAKNG